MILFLPFAWYALIKPIRREIAGGSRVWSYTSYFLAVLREFLMFALWAAAFSAMFLPKGKDFSKMFDAPPYVEWGMAAVFAGLEV